MRPPRPMTRVESSTALLVGLLLSVSLAALVVSNRTLMDQQRAQLQPESELRQALETIGRSLLNAGYYGCAAAPDETPPALRLRQPTPAELAQGLRVDRPVLVIAGSEVVEGEGAPGLWVSDCDATRPWRAGAPVPGEAQLLRPFEREIFLQRDGVWMREGNGRSRLLAAGVSDLQVARAAEADRRETADWSGAKSVQVQLSTPTARLAGRFSLRNRLP